MIQLSVDRLDRAEDIASEWRALEQRASPSFFQSWTWIGNWIEHTDAPIGVVRARIAGSLLAMGLVAFRAARRRVIVPVNVLSLHATGDSDSDRLAVEYNGFLIDRCAPADLPARILEMLGAWSSRGCFADDWDEISLPGVPEAWVAAIRASGLTSIVDRSDPLIGIAIDGMTGREEILARLGANTRAQLRHSLRALAKRGPLEVVPAQTAQAAQEFLTQLGELNIRRWSRHRLGSPYSNPAFREFHAALVARGWQRGEVELLQLRAGGEAIGYAYNFLWRQTVHHYSSGFEAETDPRVKPGMSCHLLSAERYARDGFHLYDLMAGDARYKRNLGQQHGTLYWVRAQRQRAKFRAEAGMIGIKRWLARFYASDPPSKSDK